MHQLTGSNDQHEPESGVDGAPAELQRRREAALQRRRQESAELIQSIMALAQRFFPSPAHLGGTDEC